MKRNILQPQVLQPQCRCVTSFCSQTPGHATSATGTAQTRRPGAGLEPSARPQRRISDVTVEEPSWNHHRNQLYFQLQKKKTQTADLSRQNQQSSNLDCYHPKREDNLQYHLHQLLLKDLLQDFLNQLSMKLGHLEHQWLLC